MKGKIIDPSSLFPSLMKTIRNNFVVQYFSRPKATSSTGHRSSRTRSKQNKIPDEKQLIRSSKAAPKEQKASNLPTDGMNFVGGPFSCRLILEDVMMLPEGTPLNVLIVKHHPKFLTWFEHDDSCCDVSAVRLSFLTIWHDTLVCPF